jgi:hypothetical protein
MNGLQRFRPYLADQEWAGRVPGHGGEINLERRQIGGLPMQPADAAGVWLTLGDVKGGGGRVDCYDRRPASGEGSRSAADIKDGPGAEFVGQSDIRIEI